MGAVFYCQGPIEKGNMRLWSVSTTAINLERICTFLKVFKELEGEIWNNETQRRYQILFLQRKDYGINVLEFENTLTKTNLNWLHSDTFTYKQVEEILDAKNYVGGGDKKKIKEKDVSKLKKEVV